MAGCRWLKLSVFRAVSALDRAEYRRTPSERAILPKRYKRRLPSTTVWLVHVGSWIRAIAKP